MGAMQVPPGSTGLPYLGEALSFLKDPFTFTLSRTRRHGNVWKTRILGDTVVFFAGPDAFTFFMNPDHFTRESGSPKFLQQLLHPDAVPFLDGERHKTRKRLLLSAFTNDALDAYLPNVFTVLDRFVTKWVGDGDKTLNADLSQLGFDIADVLFAASDPKTSNETGARDFSIMNKGTFAPPINLPFTAYGKALKARDRLRAYIKEQVASKDGAGSALGILKAARGPKGESLPTTELEIELLHFFFAAHGAMTAALAWLLVVLGQHPDLAKRVREEADQVLGDSLPTIATRLPVARGGVARGAARVSDHPDDLSRRREEGPRARRLQHPLRMEGRGRDLGDAAGRFDVQGSDDVRRRAPRRCLARQAPHRCVRTAGRRSTRWPQVRRRAHDPGRDAGVSRLVHAPLRYRVAVSGRDARRRRRGPATEGRPARDDHAAGVMRSA